MLYARTDLRRKRRSLSENTLQLVALAVVGLFGAVFVVAASFGAYLAGEALTAGSLDAPRSATSGARSAAAALWLGIAAVVALRTVTQNATLDGTGGLLTTVSHRDVAAGVALSEFFGLLAYLGLPAVAVAVAFAFGAGSAASALLVLLAIGSIAATGLLAGVVVGFAVRNLTVRSAFVARHRAAIWIVLFVAYLGAFVTGVAESVTAPLLSVARGLPIAWYGDLALAAVAGNASAVRAGFAVGLTVLGTPLLVALLVRLAGVLWYADPVAPAAGSGSSADRSTVDRRTALTGGVFDRVAPRPVASVAAKSWLRATRAPIKLVFVAYPAFLLVGPLSDAVETGAVSAYLVVLLAVYGAWATGAAFTLNPLGDEGAVVPATVLSGLDGRQFVAGLLLCGAAVGAPVTGGAVLLAGLLSPLSALGSALVAAVAVALCVGAAGLAVGVGTAFPRFEAARITRSRRAVVPSLTAFATYSLVLLVGSVPGLLAQLPPVAEFVGRIADVSVLTVGLAGLAATLVLAGGAGWLGFRYAARSFEEYTL
ncbi:hypothetical protein BRC90_03585 [Halobacteriales archaeon QS_4_69_34]|nr:MAG: hypothetical protein BRC90_03585 [Halobacteriales archaeon QS_4_69_34]